MSRHSVPRASTPGRRWALVGWAAAGAAGVLAVLLTVAGIGLVGGPGGPTAPERAPGPAAVAPAAGALPLSTTYATIEAAPRDTGTDAPTGGVVVHPVRETTVHDAPDGTAFARVAPTQIGDTWLPVVGEEPGWVQVLLPSRPNGSTGWLPDAGLERAATAYLVEVDLAAKRLELRRDGETVGSWTVGIGKPSAPTPPGRTFLLGAFTDAAQSYSPVILPLGTHSPTLDTFGGGPGTVAIHTWPTPDVFGTASSEGCIRVPPDALDRLTEVPLGTVVMIS